MLVKKEHPKEKPELHIRNRHRGRYDFEELVKTCPYLKPYVAFNIYNDASINFFDPAAVKMLNKALLQHFYNIEGWDIPEGYLCPPIPGRADYVHYVADLIAEGENIAEGQQIRCLDIGVGANCIYPLIGHQQYGWSFVGSDIDPVSIAAANRTLVQNPTLKGGIELRLQPNNNDIFNGIIKEGEWFDATICNPPFHGSQGEAQVSSARKLTNLTGKKTKQPVLNFAGQSNELWCIGGEGRFINTMILQSKQHAESCGWFTTLVAKSEHLPNIYRALERIGATEVKTIAMGQGNKTSRIVAWTFMERKQAA